MSSVRAGGQKVWYKKHIRIFLTTWNQLRVSLETNGKSQPVHRRCRPIHRRHLKLCFFRVGELKIPAEYCQSDMDHGSDFRVLLPQRQGPGLCSTALISYLISLHNSMVYCMDKHTGEETRWGRSRHIFPAVSGQHLSFFCSCVEAFEFSLFSSCSYRVSPVDLTDLHVIRYELERDLMSLILSNTQYSIERGQETLPEYDLARIQQQLISRFLLGKPLITMNVSGGAKVRSFTGLHRRPKFIICFVPHRGFQR